ncbi:tetratricopeptide repeat domain-containing protein [Ophiostoma piceae UAMH 11346]|uniref:Tetratricopeptide repeat domain-containing protein n=1 Tax=Ophiostoma piceae (strain UAMH 11346) TaxID=1262450 RepID=S3CLI4_OPHP1|nr:tetratricopeptide repeat domain-containing protein [Ophiostoma piceae UAMH 11346]
MGLLMLNEDNNVLQQEAEYEHMRWVLLRCERWGGRTSLIQGLGRLVDASTDRKPLIDLFIKYGDGSRDHSDVDKALDWLSNLQHTWLLIIDNADQPKLNIARYIPKSSKGCVLITTRSKMHISLNTVEQRHCSFSGLKKDETTERLLKTSRVETHN